MINYETGIADDVLDLLDKLAVFADDAGWTIDYHGSRTSGSGEALQLTKGAMACTFIADTTASTGANPGPYFGCYQHDAYNAGNGTENQANASEKCFANGMAGPYVAYHFMAGEEQGSEYLYVVVETAAGTFKHIGVGRLVGFGELQQGTFAFASNWSYSSSWISTWNIDTHAVPFDERESTSAPWPGTVIREDGDDLSPRWFHARQSASSATYLRGGVRRSGESVYSPMLCGASAITGRAVLFPCWMAGARGSSYFSPLGYPPGMRWVKLDYLSPGDILTLGTDQWRVFPVIRKNGGPGQPTSGTYGYAYRVDDGS